MFGIELFHIYLACLVFGVGYAIVVSLLGAMGGSDHDGSGGMDHGGDLHAGDVHADGHDFHGDSGHAGTDAGLPMFSPLMIATFATIFGGLGFMTLGLFGILKIIPDSVSGVVSVLVSASLGIVLSSYFSFFLMKIFIKSETSSNISTAKLVGREAEVTVAIEPGHVGEIAYLHAGSRQTTSARLAEGSPGVKKGDPVEIVSVNDNCYLVRAISAKERDLPV